MSELDDLKFAMLSDEDLATIRMLEKKLGPTIRLVAVESKMVLYAVEAKMGPNLWQRVDAVYPEIKNVKAYYNELEAAKEAKAGSRDFCSTTPSPPNPKSAPSAFARWSIPNRRISREKRTFRYHPSETISLLSTVVDNTMAVRVCP